MTPRDGEATRRCDGNVAPLPRADVPARARRPRRDRRRLCFVLSVLLHAAALLPFAWRAREELLPSGWLSVSVAPAEEEPWQDEAPVPPPEEEVPVPDELPDLEFEVEEAEELLPEPMDLEPAAEAPPVESPGLPGIEVAALRVARREPPVVPERPPTARSEPPRPPPPAPPPAAPRAGPRRPGLVAVYAPRYYPEAARERRLQGSTRVEMRVDTTGLVVDAWVVESSGEPILDEAALRSARATRFRPIEAPRRAKRWYHFSLDG